MISYQADLSQLGVRTRVRAARARRRCAGPDAPRAVPGDRPVISAGRVSRRRASRSGPAGQAVTLLGPAVHQAVDADLARRVAAATGERLFPGVQALTATQAGRRARGGSSELGRAPSRLMSIAPDAVPPLDDVRHEARPIPAPDPAFPTSPGIRSARLLETDPDRLSLAEADFILSAGNGLTDWEAFAELAEALGATRGGSRVVCDAGHLPRDRQIGASGTLVTARCYLALGIAGAPQHLQGITEVKHVIAVNTDLHAEMIKRADLAIVADAQAVMPALIRHARERRRERGAHG